VFRTGSRGKGSGIRSSSIHTCHLEGTLAESFCTDVLEEESECVEVGDDDEDNDDTTTLAEFFLARISCARLFFSSMIRLTSSVEAVAIEDEEEAATVETEEEDKGNEDAGEVEEVMSVFVVDETAADDGNMGVVVICLNAFPSRVSAAQTKLALSLVVLGVVPPEAARSCPKGAVKAGLTLFWLALEFINLAPIPPVFCTTRGLVGPFDFSVGIVFDGKFDGCCC